MRAEADAWFATRTWSHTYWSPAAVADLVAATGSRVSVVIPARDEEATVADVVSVIRRELVEAHPVVAELVVIDSDSTDATAERARDAGAVVHAASQVAPHLGSHPGKGEALWKSLFVTTGDLLVFVDADLSLWGPHFVTGLLGPLLVEPQVQLVKGFYDRILARDGAPPSPEGGRVTELVARPLLNLWWPELAGLVQPLAGEWAARRSLMESVEVPTGYGVEIGAVVDTYARHGLDGLAQVDLGARAHHHQKDHDLAVMAAELLAVARDRCESRPSRSDRSAGGARTLRGEPTLHQFHRDDRGREATSATAGAVGSWAGREVPLAQRPPALSCPGYPGLSAHQEQGEGGPS